MNAYILWSNNTSSYQGIQWSSSNTSVATVSSSGYVTAKSAGTATITASYGSYSKTCTVTVKAAQSSQPSGGGNGGNDGTQTQPSQPSGGGNGGNGGSGNGGSGNGDSGNGSSGNGGSTSKPSDGGSSGNGGSGNGGSTQTPSIPSTTVDTKYYPKGDYFKSQGCQVVTTMSGRTTYDITNLILSTINKYRQQEWVSKLSACTYEYEYNEFIRKGEYIKNNKPRRAERIKAGEDSTFNTDFTPRSSVFNRDIFNSNTVDLANCIELASAGGHGDGHAAQILTDAGKYDIDNIIGGMKQRSSTHWNALMDSDATSIQVILYISNENATDGTQGYHLAISVGHDTYYATA